MAHSVRPAEGDGCGPTSRAKTRLPKGHMYRFFVLLSGLLMIGGRADPAEAVFMLGGLVSPAAIASNPQGAPFIAEAGGRIVQLLAHNLASPLGSVDDKISSLAFDAQGSLYAAGSKAIWKVSTSGQAMPVLKGVAASGIAVGPDGTIFFLDAASSRVCRLVDGQAVVMTTAVAQPSALAASSGALFVAGRDSRIWRLKAPGGGSPSLFATLRGEGQPVAMALDEAGNVYIARDNGGRVAVLNAAGQPGDGYSIPGPRVTALAFGGVELKDLYVTEAQKGAVYKVHVAHRAARLAWEPDKPLRITDPMDGAILNRCDGEAVPGGLRITVKGMASGAGRCASTAYPRRSGTAASKPRSS